MTERTPWTALLSLSSALAATPEQFWRLSLCEWRALAPPATHCLDRNSLDALMRRFPDQSHG